jgi:dihydroorotase
MKQSMPCSTWTLLIRGGRVIDPRSEKDSIADVAIAGDRIAAVGPGLAARRREGTRVVNATGAVVLPGLIDMHAHVFEHVSGDFGLNPDLVGVRSGVPVVVDQGGPSALTIDGFRRFIVEPSRSRVLCFISSYLAGGLHGHKYVDLYGPPGIDVEAIVKAAEANRDLVKGIKAHAEPGGYSRWGVEPLRLAKQASRQLKLPVYVHLGTLWPEKDRQPVDTDAIVRDVLPLLDPGDILAHPYTRHPSGVVGPDGKVHPLILEAIRKGVRIDVGRGSHISFETARRALDQGVVPFTVGADLHGYNVRRPKGLSWYRGTFAVGPKGEIDEEFSFVAPYSLHHAMSEMRALGIPLVEVLRMATSNAAAVLGLDAELGTLAPARPADISIVNVLSGRWRLKDSRGDEIVATEMIHPRLSVRAGKVMRVDSPLLPDLERLAA